MSTSAPDDWRPTDHGFPEDFVPPPGVRYLIHGHVITVIDNRPGDTTERPLPEHVLRQLREGRRPPPPIQS